MIKIRILFLLNIQVHTLANVCIYYKYRFLQNRQTFWIGKAFLETQYAIKIRLRPLLNQLSSPERNTEIRQNV